jgi:isoleucyl-tRNA synthetase
LLRLAAPLIAFTAEEIWKHFPRRAGDPESVHLALFPAAEELGTSLDAAVAENWGKLLGVRTEVLRALEAARNAKTISGALEAKVILSAGADLAPLLGRYKDMLAALFIVSQVELSGSTIKDAQKSGTIPGLEVAVRRADGTKCERCWNYSTHVGENADYPTVCERCVKALAEIEQTESAPGHCWFWTAPLNLSSSAIPRHLSTGRFSPTLSFWFTTKIRASRSACSPGRLPAGWHRFCWRARLR